MRHRKRGTAAIRWTGGVPWLLGLVLIAPTLAAEPTLLAKPDASEVALALSDHFRTCSQSRMKLSRLPKKPTPSVSFVVMLWPV